MSTILSGEQITLAHSKTNYELPPIGIKEFEPSNSWLEQKQIQSVLDHRKTLLETERVEKESNLMLAEWVHEKRKAAVSRKGKHWETFGHHSDNKDWLFPEEALFLMEMNCLQCFYGEVPLSIQKGYSVLLKLENGCTLNEYRVFAHLCRTGYRVLRHLPNLTVTAYERTIRLDQHLKERKTYDVEVDVDEMLSDVGANVTSKQMLKKPEEVTTQVPNTREEIIIGKTQTLKETAKKCVGVLTKRKLRKIRRRNEKLREKFLSAQDGWKIKKTQALRILHRRKLHSILGKHRKEQSASGNQTEEEKNAEVGLHQLNKTSSTSHAEDDSSEIPSERWQPPVVITDLPENIEMTIGSTPIQAEDRVKEQAAIEVIDIADTSSSEEQESEKEDSDSDIEIIQEIRLPATIDNRAEEDDEDEMEIIEVPVPKREIIVETLSSDSEDESEQEEGSDSESDRSYDGNWKRNRVKKKTRFVRPPTMSHFTFAAVDEFCMEKKPFRENTNGGVSSNIGCNDSAQFLRLESSDPSMIRAEFRVENTRNDILDMMPTMAGQNRKLVTLDIPDLRLIPDNIIPKQQSYTYSTNALKARVFRQGFRGRRNFHGPRFTGSSPYYNNASENLHLHQFIPGGAQGLLQTPQLSHVFGNGDASSVARGVMQIATALMMSYSQSNVNNCLLPFSSNPLYPVMNPVFSPNPPAPCFPPVNRNFSFNESRNMNSPGFNKPQRNNLERLFDMPQQRNFGAPNHIRFPDSTSSSVFENHQNNQNSSVDLSRSSESEFESSDQNFTPPNLKGHSAGRNFRNNRASNFRSKKGTFRSKRGTFRSKNRNHRGGFSQKSFSEGTSRHSHSIDPAYIKPDVPIPGEQNSFSENSLDFIPLGSSSSDDKPIEIISVDDNDDGFVPKGGISHRLSKKKRKRKLMRLKEKAKKKCLNQNPEENKHPEVVFLDSPNVDKLSSEEPLSDSVKQEIEIDAQVKTETENECRNVKQEVETPVEPTVKQDSVGRNVMKIENEVETRVKTEEISGESSGVRVKVEQEEAGQNVRVEIKIESSSDTSSVTSLSLQNLVKEEPSQIKLEPVEGVEVKTESVAIMEAVKTENFDEQGNIEKVVEKSDKSGAVESGGRNQADSVDSSASESGSRTKQNKSVSVHRTDSNIEMEVEQNEIDCRSSEVCCSRTELTVEDIKSRKVSNWAEIKKNNLPLSTFRDTSQDETEDKNEDEEEIRPFLRPKHCKTIGTVLSALQIFTPFTCAVPENVCRLKISFDLYLPTEFRKSHRGLPQYRIVVFSGTEPLPSPAQLREVNSRFQDSVPVLTAVVTPGSVVFYTFTDIDLPQDSTSYTK